MSMTLAAGGEGRKDLVGSLVHMNGFGFLFQIDLVLARGESGHWAVARDERSHPILAKELRDGRLYDRALAILAR